LSSPDAFLRPWCSVLSSRRGRAQGQTRERQPGQAGTAIGGLASKEFEIDSRQEGTGMVKLGVFGKSSRRRVARRAALLGRVGLGRNFRQRIQRFSSSGLAGCRAIVSLKIRSRQCFAPAPEPRTMKRGPGSTPAPGCRWEITAEFEKPGARVTRFPKGAEGLGLPFAAVRPPPPAVITMKTKDDLASLYDRPEIRRGAVFSPGLQARRWWPRSRSGGGRLVAASPANGF